MTTADSTVEKFPKTDHSVENFLERRALGIEYPLIHSEETLRTIAEHRLFWFLKDMGNPSSSAGVVEEFLYKEGVFELQQTHKQLWLSWAENETALKFSFATLGKDSENQLNEDAILIQPFGKNRFIVAVFDGATSQKTIAGLKKIGVSGAFYVSHLASLGFPRVK